MKDLDQQFAAMASRIEKIEEELRLHHRRPVMTREHALVREKLILVACDVAKGKATVADLRSAVLEYETMQ